jgi:hypothetical protein
VKDTPWFDGMVRRVRRNCSDTFVAPQIFLVCLVNVLAHPLVRDDEKAGATVTLQFDKDPVRVRVRWTQPVVGENIDGPASPAADC